MNPIYAKTATYKKFLINEEELNILKSENFKLEDFVSFLIKRFDIGSLLDKYRIKFSSLTETLERAVIKNYYNIENKIMDYYSIINPKFLKKKEVLKQFLLLEDIKIVIFAYKNKTEFEEIKAYLNNPELFENNYKNNSLELLLRSLGFDINLEDELEAINKINYLVHKKIFAFFPNNPIIKELIKEYDHNLKLKEKRWKINLDKYKIHKNKEINKIKSEEEMLKFLKNGLKNILDSEDFLISLIFLFEYNKKILIRLINLKNKNSKQQN